MKEKELSIQKQEQIKNVLKRNEEIEKKKLFDYNIKQLKIMEKKKELEKKKKHKNKKK